MAKAWSKLIVALDVTSEKKAKKIVRALMPQVRIFKIGPIAYFSLGEKIIRHITRKGAKVFLDFKLYDIPNTMLKTAENFVDMGVWAFTVHTKAGEETLGFLKKELTKAAKRKKKRCPLIIGITELTSSKASLSSVMKLARVAKKAKIDGVVCSVWEARAIKRGYRLLTITPGIRKKGGSDDQKRVASVHDALNNKADYFVVGRPIVASRNYRQAAEDMMSG